MDSKYAETVSRYPFLASPATLAREFYGRRFWLEPHLAYLNERLKDVAFGLLDRLIVNMPSQHGKTWLGSRAFPAWVLLHWPQTRVALGSYANDYAMGIGSTVKDMVSQFGPPLGIELRKDRKAKGEWGIRGHEGGMVCKGRQSGLTGRPADLLVLDDLIKDNVEALSEKVLEQVWNWYVAVAWQRLGPKAPIVAVGTRWATRDHFGRILAESEGSDERWRVVKFKAIAEADDVLGRKEGEALWPRRVPLKRLLYAKEKRHFWFRANYQQEPEAPGGTHFHPDKWPTWDELGGAYAVREEGKARRFWTPDQLLRLVSVDWAFSEKTTGDRSAIGVFFLTPAGELLIIDVVNRRLALNELAPELANVCRRWRPAAVGIEDGHPTLKTELRRWPDVPEVRWLRVAGRDKLQRAVPAMNKAFNGKLVLPEKEQKWQAAYAAEMRSFTGVGDEHDDCVDMTAWAAQMADWWAPLAARGAGGDDCGPELITAGREEFWR